MPCVFVRALLELVMTLIRGERLFLVRHSAPGKPLTYCNSLSLLAPMVR